MPARRRDFILDIWGVLPIAVCLAIPLLSHAPLTLSLTHQVVVGLTAALGVYVMLRLGLLAFTVPAFMAMGGYATAIAASSWNATNLLVLMALSFLVPVIVAVPLGALILRLKGTYFIFVTFIFNEILQLVLFETPDLTGGSNGIAGVPPASFFGMDLGSPQSLVAVTIVVGVVAAAIALAVTNYYRPEFSSIEENETLAESLGVAVWRYRTIGFVVSAGVSGLAGFALVNMLSTAHPSEFESFSAVNYIAYVFIGGRGTLLGVTIGSALLIVMSNIFSSQAQYSAGLFGLLLIVVMMIAPTGIVGAVLKRLPVAKGGAK
jgi:branched-chain amino acid transport system permease protein